MGGSEKFSSSLSTLEEKMEHLQSFLDHQLDKQSYSNPKPQTAGSGFRNYHTEQFTGRMNIQISVRHNAEHRDTANRTF